MTTDVPAVDPTATVDCEFCGNGFRRDRLVDHIGREHGEQLELFAARDHAPDERAGTHPRALPAERPVCTLTGPPPAGFHQWWRAQVDDAAPTIQRKAEEYGSNSLAEMGRVFARARGVDHAIADAEALEIGCMIYAKGKLERVVDAMLKGRLPSTDTWMDLMVYSAMAQFVREHKRWP